MIDPGRLDTRLRIDAPVEIFDGQGGVLRSYQPLATVWAQITPRPMRSAADAAAAGAVARYRIVLRSHHPLTLRHRLVEADPDGDAVYRIVALRDDARCTEIDAELRQD
jgi:head-tail adaptor